MEQIAIRPARQEELEDIIRAMENGARSLKEIKAATGAMSHCDCANKNPKGT